MTEDEMVGWHHRLNGHQFEEDLGDSEALWDPRLKWWKVLSGLIPG